MRKKRERKIEKQFKVGGWRGKMKNEGEHHYSKNTPDDTLDLFLSLNHPTVTLPLDKSQLK